MGGKLKALLCRELESHPLVGDIRGRGLFWAVEFVLDKDLKTPLPLKANFQLSGREEQSRPRAKYSRKSRTQENTESIIF